MPLSPEERRDLLLSVGTHKNARRLRPVRVAELLHRLAQEKPYEEVAKEIGFSETSTIRKFVSLLRLPDELQDLVIFGGMPGYLSFSVAAELTKAESDSIQPLTHAALEHKLSKEEARAIIQCMKRGGGELPRCVTTVLGLRPRIEHQSMFVGRLPSTRSDDQSARDALRRFLAARVGSENVLAVSARGGRFAFLLTDEAARNPSIAGDLTSERLDALVERVLSGVSQ